MCNANFIDFLFWYFVVVAVVGDEFLIRSARQLTIDKTANISFRMISSSYFPFFFSAWKHERQFSVWLNSLDSCSRIAIRSTLNCMLRWFGTSVFASIRIQYWISYFLCPCIADKTLWLTREKKGGTTKKTMNLYHTENTQLRRQWSQAHWTTINLTKTKGVKRIIRMPMRRVCVAPISYYMMSIIHAIFICVVVRFTFKLRR